jgi:SHS2 domain-containing protein
MPCCMVNTWPLKSTVTFHEFSLKKDPDGTWRARVMLDI